MPTPAPAPEAARAFLLPPGAVLATEAARLILQGHTGPDLSALTVVVPHQRLYSPLRLALLREAGGVLMAPRLATLATLATPERPVRSPLACVLRLAEALERFRFLFPGQVSLRVAEALYALFDDIDRHGLAEVADAEALSARLQAAYGSPRPLPELSREAEIVHRLHTALKQEFGDSIPAVAETQALRQLQQDERPMALAFVGFDQLRPVEADFVRHAITHRAALFIAQGRTVGRDGRALAALQQALGLPMQALESAAPGPRTRLLDAAFDSGAGIRARALALRPAGVDAGDLALVAATDPEHEAQCADLAVREALLAGAQRVAVVCDDRRLARRLRARLERAAVPLADRGGWALSTSRAAATLDAWLDCAERDFPYRPLFALLKSGFVAGGETWAAALEPLAWRSAIAGGEAHWRAVVAPADRARLAQLVHAATALHSVSGEHLATVHADGLLESLRRLGLDERLAADRAGARVLARLHELRSALDGTGMKLSWNAFRALFDRALEDASFASESPASGGVSVQLLTLDQSQGLSADAVVLTSATPALLASAETPFFNAGVRRELGLPTPAQAQALRFARLRQLLEAAPRVRLLHAPEEAGEEAQLAPPLLALRAFAAAAGAPLRLDRGLATRAPQAEIASDSPLPVPMPRAAPAADTTLLTRPLSAAGHQALIDCPYRFHARYALGLEQLQEPDAAVDRSDYGDRVHRILCAFEQAQDDLPAPWQGPREASQLPAMAAHLRRIAAAVFAPDLAARPLARFWQQAFARLTPWLAAQLASWPEAATRVEVELASHRDGWALRGRADRIDADAERARLVDYKTGAVPRPADLVDGESVQLPHYALLVPQASELEYWNLKDEKVQRLDPEALTVLKPALQQRLQTLAVAMERGAPLPAHGAEDICVYCEFIGVCRKQDRP